MAPPWALLSMQQQQDPLTLNIDEGPITNPASRRNQRPKQDTSPFIELFAEYAPDDRTI
jgi:hypothetical protein